MTDHLDELFVPYLLAVKLREKGFNEPCLGHYDDYELLIGNSGAFSLDFAERDCSYNSRIYEEAASAPLYQQAIDWLDKKHGLGIEIALDATLMWVWRITPLHPKATYQEQTTYTYVYSIRNDAVTAAIEEALRLIPNTNE